MLIILVISGEARAHCYWVQLYCLWYNLSLKFNHSTNLLKIWQKSLGSFAPKLSTPAPPLLVMSRKKFAEALLRRGDKGNLDVHKIFSPPWMEKGVAHDVPVPIMLA